MTPRSLRVVAAAAGATVLLAPPAHAADEIALSRDGRTWSSALREPLFAPQLRWVPGDVRTSSFHVRNDSATGGDLVVELVDARDEPGHRPPTGRGFVRRDLTVSSRVAGGPWLGPRASDRPGRSVVTVPAGGRRRVDVRVAFDASSTLRSRTAALDLRLRVSLAESTSSSAGAGGAALPMVGGAASAPWLLAAGVAALGAGLHLRRRQRAAVES